MNTYNVSRSVRFEAAHFIKDHGGKCQRMHGHSYLVTAEWESSSLDALNMVVDFGVLDEMLETVVVQPFDHRILNDVLKVDNLTAELLAETIGTGLYALTCGRKLNGQIARVTVAETPDSSATWWR